MSVEIDELSAEHHHNGFGISEPSPRLSWRFKATTVKGWQQKSYTLRVRRDSIPEDEVYTIVSSESVLVPWPSTPLSSREKATIEIRATGQDSSQTPPAVLNIEMALLSRFDWKAKLISGPEQPLNMPKQPFRLRKSFEYRGGTARLYATAHGIYHVEINGQVVGDQVLTPGWRSYKHYLNYQVYDVTDLLRVGENVIGAYVGEGWYAGRLGRPGVSNIWGDRPGFLAQLEIDKEPVCITDSTWEWLEGPVTCSEIYNGENYNTLLEDEGWATKSASARGLGNATELQFPGAQLQAIDAAPVRRVMSIAPKEIITTPSGKKVLDFGQNLVGWLRINTDIRGPKQLVIKHAEVLEHGELGTRPLRTAKATSTIQLGGASIKGYEAKFTWYGFRYAEINGYNEVQLADFTAIVISSDLRRTGYFRCSHEEINKLHENTVWSMRGNFVSVPTDCPQRDERLGWTGDIQVFAPTANFIYDTTAFLSTWLRDLEADQRDLGGIVPTIIPVIPIPPRHPERRAMAVWGDTAVITPWDVYNASGDQRVLEAQWDSMVLWLESGVPRGDNGLYSTENPQYGDWLDPRAPPHLPGHSPTDALLIANAYLILVTGVASNIGSLLGKTEAAENYSYQAIKLRNLFREEFITPKGRLASDTQAAYAIALRFGLFDSDDELHKMRSRLDWLVKWEAFKITTGFAATPIILHVLAENDMLQNAYRMLQERDCPSWLYPVLMGATTVWERWNSMLPDGTINPGQMTSFNHYALGSVCSFLHSTVGGLSSASPGWKSALVRPQPGGTVRHADTRYDSPYGPYTVNWELCGEKLHTKVTVPPNGEAHVILDDVDEVVKSGEYVYETFYKMDDTWPPEPIQGLQGNAIPSFFI